MAIKTKEKPYLEVRRMSLEEWLPLAMTPSEKRTHDFIDYQFPSDPIRDAYLASAHERVDKEVKDLLRILLIPTGSLGRDFRLLKSLIASGQLLEVQENFEFGRRLLNLKVGAWEGTTWILDLLPSYPQLAIDAIRGYLTAHISFMPDGRIDGLYDAMAVIRAKYIEVEHPRDILLAITPRDFEKLVGLLFSNMGYEVELTPESRDGGYDVIATKSDRRGTESVLVECKRYDKPIGVKEVRALSGVVEVHRANRGFIVTTSSFTGPAAEFAERVKRVSLVGYKELNGLLNEHLGTDWAARIDSHIGGLDRMKRMRAAF